MYKKVYERSCNYRKRFFDKKKGILGTNKYHCAYCGKILSKRNVQVDHLIPINKVRGPGIGRLTMRLMGIKDINSPKNLVASCEKCNKKKSDNMSGWIWSGLFGRHFVFWIIVWLFKVFIIVAAIYIILCFADHKYMTYILDRI